MRRIIMLSIIALSACASSKTGAMEGVETVRIVGGTGAVTELTTSASTTPSVASVHAPLDQIWRALPAVYESLAIPVGQLDTATHTIGNPGLRIRRRLGGTPLTRYFDCGSTQGGPNAETYEIHLSVLTRVEQGASGATTVTTTIQSMARPVSFAGEFVRCTSTGALEARIVDTLKESAQG